MNTSSLPSDLNISNPYNDGTRYSSYFTDVSGRQCEESESEVAQSFPTLCDPVDCSMPGSFAHGILQARILEWSRSLLQGIFPTQGLNPRFLHCRQILYHLSHQGRHCSLLKSRQLISLCYRTLFRYVANIL